MLQYLKSFGCALLVVLCLFLVMVVLAQFGLTRVGLQGSNHYTEIRNLTGTAVSAYVQAGEDSYLLAHLQPGDTYTTNWALDDRRMFRALDANGNLVYCRTFTWRDMEALGWRIEILKGNITCN